MITGILGKNYKTLRATGRVEYLRKNYKWVCDEAGRLGYLDVEGELLLIKAINYVYENVVEAMLKMGANANCVT